MEAKSHLRLAITAQEPSFCEFDVVVPAHFVSTLCHEASRYHQSTVQAHGFQKGKVPLEYIQVHYQHALLEHVKEFLLKYIVLSFVYQELHNHKIPIACEPKLRAISIEPDQDATFHFFATLAQSCSLRSWRHYPFKAPQRKNYRDLDRQVQAFIKQEMELAEKHASDPIKVGDWVSFNVAVLNSTNIPLLNSHQELVWIKLGNEEADVPFVEIFEGKCIGDRFVMSNQCLQEYFSHQIDTNYPFNIEIVDVIPHAYVSLKHIKQAFKLRTNKDLHKKIIEVFSYRNDISQRRETVQAAFDTLLTRNPIQAPAHLVSRQKQDILTYIRENPDYLVYKTTPGFEATLDRLAEKQVKETILIDQLALKEHINVTHEDILWYLNFLKRPRMKEFVYFTLPNTKINGRETPLSAALLKRYCLREKTLNYAIYHLTKS